MASKQDVSSKINPRFLQTTSGISIVYSKFWVQIGVRIGTEHVHTENVNIFAGLSRDSLQLFHRVWRTIKVIIIFEKSQLLKCTVIHERREFSMSNKRKIKIPYFSRFAKHRLTYMRAMSWWPMSFSHMRYVTWLMICCYRRHTKLMSVQHRITEFTQVKQF